MVSVGGKTLRDHLEAVDHYDALQWMREQAASSTKLVDGTVCELHRRIVLRSQPKIAGLYSPFPRRIAESAVVFPNPGKVPQLIKEFGCWLSNVKSVPSLAFDAHFKLTAIHPFSDGNGRTARLLMNLMLIRGGYPPISVRPEDRNRYLAVLERASLAEDLTPFQHLLHERLDATLDEYLSAVRESLP